MQAFLRKDAGRGAHSRCSHTCGLKSVFPEAHVLGKNVILILFRHLRMTELCEALSPTRSHCFSIDSLNAQRPGSQEPGRCAFEPVDKVDRLSQKCKHFFEELQAAASHSLRSHVCGLSRVFSDAHVAGKTDWHFIPSSSDDGTLRGSYTKF